MNLSAIFTKGKDKKQATGPFKPVLSSGFLLNLAFFCMALYIFVIPFPHRTALQEICFYLSFLSLVLLVSKRELGFLKTPLEYPLLFLLAWCIVSSFFSINFQNSFHDIYSYYFKFLIVFALIVQAFRSHRKFLILIWIISVSSLFLAIGGMVYFYYLEKNPLLMRIGLPEVGIGVNYIGFFTIPGIAFSLVLVSQIKNRLTTIFPFVFCLILSVTTLFTYTRGTFLGLLPLSLLFLRFKRAFFFFITVMLILFMLVPGARLFTKDKILDKLQSDDRKSIWLTYLDVIEDYPLTGIGFGMEGYNKPFVDAYNVMMPEEHKFRYEHVYAPHNTLIDITVRLGLPGLLLFLYAVFISLRMSFSLFVRGHNDFVKDWSLCLASVLFSFFIQGLFADMLLGVQAVLLYIIMALLTVLWTVNSSEEQQAIGHNSEENR